MKSLNKITTQEENFGQWYTDVVKNGKLIKYGPVRGTMIMLPNSFGLWENIQNVMNGYFKKLNVENVSLPLLIPMSYINKEKDHVKGFAPELATITKVGQEDLDEDLVIRPTSEVLFSELFASMTTSYKDLPIIYNQWASVLRWEKNTRPFLRTTEFLWQEGHTVHSMPLEARKFTRKVAKIYSKFLRDYLAIPTILGKKTSREKFAGATTTYTLEAMMKDGRALQSATSHYLGQGFAKTFNINFTNKVNAQEFAYQTSWGLSTRVIGAIIMTHGDNKGVIMPPKIAPTQIDIIEVFAKPSNNVAKVSMDLYKSLSRKYRTNIDASSKSPGFKASESEIQGVPIRIEVGPRDLENNEVIIVRRDTGKKINVKVEDVKKKVDKLISEIHDNLLNTAEERLLNNIVPAKDYNEFKELIEDRKFVLVPFAGSDRIEKRIQDETGATARCIPLKTLMPKTFDKCFYTKKPTQRYVVFARAY